MSEGHGEEGKLPTSPSVNTKTEVGSSALRISQTDERAVVISVPSIFAEMVST